MTPATASRDVPAVSSVPPLWRQVLGAVLTSVAVGGAAGYVVQQSYGAKAVALAGGASLLAMSLSGMWSAPRWKRWQRAIVGAVGGVGVSVLFVAMCAALPFGALNVVLAGAMGGAALGSVFTDGVTSHRSSRLRGIVAATGTGMVGALALGSMQAYFASENTALATSTAVLAGAFALWVSAAAGIARLQPEPDPLMARASELMRSLADPMRTKVAEALASWNEILLGLDTMDDMSADHKRDAQTHATALMTSVLDTATTWRDISKEVHQPRAMDLQQRITELMARAEAATDPTTKAHLARAQHAMNAQLSAVQSLQVALGRADAAMDAQGALLERLRFAIAQHRVSDRERFHVELQSVAEEATRVSADLETLSSAMEDTDRITDQRALADFERALRVSLGQAAPATMEVEESAPVAR
jgi:predicted  nucleic acid-binding Zn-ribbon protein